MHVARSLRVGTAGVAAGVLAAEGCRAAATIRELKNAKHTFGAH